MTMLSYMLGSSVSRSLDTDIHLVKTDTAGRLEVVTAGSTVPIYGVAGDGTSLNPFRMVNFRPQAAKGAKLTFGGASAAIGPLDVGKTYHIFCTAICWINKGGAAVVAAAGDTAIQNGAVYEYIPTAVGVDDYIAVVQDAVGGGDIFISRVED